MVDLAMKVDKVTADINGWLPAVDFEPCGIGDLAQIRGRGKAIVLTLRG